MARVNLFFSHINTFIMGIAIPLTLFWDDGYGLFVIAINGISALINLKVYLEESV